MKNKSGSHSNLDICSLHFEIFSSDMKFQIGAIINLRLSILLYPKTQTLPNILLEITLVNNYQI